MPEKTTMERARRDQRAGKASTTQAGEFVREEMEHVKRGKHGAKSRKQAIAIGLNKARRAGVKLGGPRKGKAKTKKTAARSRAKGRTGPLAGGGRKKTSRATSAKASRGRKAAARKSTTKSTPRRQTRTAAKTARRSSPA